ncbi:hypothetical protein FRC11_002830 [Ceratobasidium sp. 423]|nr:hypothetical protein FRC11_002830 [Ceratobasidium sp. 423]
MVVDEKKFKAVYLIRHGQAECNIDNRTWIPDAVLTDLGRSQCVEFRESTLGHSIQDSVELILTSPQRRALSTTLLGLPDAVERLLPQSRVVLVPQLQEINDLPCDRGSDREFLESMPEYTTELKQGRLDFSPLTPDWNQKQGIYDPSPDVLWARAQWVRHFIRERKEQTIAVVAHGNFIRYLVGLDGYYDRVKVLQEEQAVLIGLATGAHDMNQGEVGQFSVFKINFPPLHPDVSISQILEMRIDIPITGLFMERGLTGVVGTREGTAALQIYDRRTRQGILLDTGIKLGTDCDLDVIAFPEEIVLYAEDSEHSVLHTYAVENIHRMLSLVTHHNPQTVAQVGGGFLVESSEGDSSSNGSTPPDNGSNPPATARISLPPRRSCRRDIKDKGVGVFRAGYTMLKKSHISSRDSIPYDGKMSVLTMSLRQLENDGAQVRCLTHHFLKPLASPSSTPSTNTRGSTSTYLSTNSSPSSPHEPLDDRPLRHTFAHILEQNGIAKGPTGYDLVSFGEGGTSVVWLARTRRSDTDFDDEVHEHDGADLEFWVATFPAASPNSPFQECVRRLQLPRTINPSLTAALDLDDTEGVLCIATTRGEIFRLRFD